MTYYVPIIGMVILATVFVAIMITASVLIGPHRYNSNKYGVFETGIDTVDRPEDGGRMSLKYFTVAMMFIIFDVETIFLFPFAVAFDLMGWFMLVEMLLFIVTLLAAYIYVWRRGGLDWE